MPGGFDRITAFWSYQFRRVPAADVEAYLNRGWNTLGQNMSFDVALFGTAAVDAIPLIKNNIPGSVNFHPVPDLNDAEHVTEVLRNANVVVGRWPNESYDAPHLHLVHHTGAGTDHYDFETIPSAAYICNVYEHEQAIVEHVFMLLLALTRELIIHDKRLRMGLWPESDSSGMFPEIGGMTMGIVGFGHIGRNLVEPARALGLDVLAIRSSRPTETGPDGVEFVGGPDDLDRVIDDADALVLALPLNDQTRGMIGVDELELLGPGGYLINVSRGAIVEQEALYQALVNDRIAGAGIDTWWEYPEGREPRAPAKYPFQELSNVVMTPHEAGWTHETARNRMKFIAENISRINRGERPKNVVREPVKTE